MAIVQLNATQGGGTSYFDEAQVHVFHAVPDWGHFAVGDAVPAEWDYQAIGLLSIGPVEEMAVTERDGYEAGYAGKTDPNPFIVDSYNYQMYKVGRERGDRERLAMDDYEIPGKN